MFLARISIFMTKISFFTMILIFDKFDFCLNCDFWQNFFYENFKFFNLPTPDIELFREHSAYCFYTLVSYSQPLSDVPHLVV